LEHTEFGKGVVTVEKLPYPYHRRLVANMVDSKKATSIGQKQNTWNEQLRRGNIRDADKGDWLHQTDAISHSFSEGLGETGILDPEW